MVLHVQVCWRGHILLSKAYFSPTLDGLAWDWVSEKLYWTDYCQDDIEVYDPSSGHRTVLFNTELSQPRAIVVDPTTK